MITQVCKFMFSKQAAGSKLAGFLTATLLVTAVLALNSCSATPVTNVSPSPSGSAKTVTREAVISKSEFESAKKRLNVQYDKFTKTIVICTPVTKEDALIVDLAQAVLNFCVYSDHAGPSIGLLVAYFSSEYLNMQGLAVNSSGKNFFFDLKKNHSKTLSNQSVSDNHTETSSVKLGIADLPMLSNLAKSKNASWRIYGSSTVYDRSFDSIKLKRIADLVTIVEGYYWGFK